MNQLRSRWWLSSVGRYVLALLLFSQAALALSGCMMPSGGFPQMAASAESGADGGMNLNLCLAHCSAGDQSLDLNLLPPIAPPSTPMLFVLSGEPHEQRPLFVERLERATDPPIPIRFCSFLI